MKKNKKPSAPAASPVRDEKALIFPISAIKIGANVREKLENIEELAASIKQTGGLLQPLVIAKTAGGFELVAGQRRLAALKLLGEKTAPVRVLGPSTGDINVIRLVENLQRDELSGWETCKAIHSLLPEFKTQRELATAVGKSEGFISRCIAVVNAKPELARVQVMSLRELFSIFSKANDKRKPSGALPGGRYVANAIHFKDRGGTFSLRLNYGEATPPETKQKIIATLQEILKRLEQN